jgi:glycerol-3-phosphate dehydrogenase (NAD(P)+)
MSLNTAVLGSGSWGTALANLFAQNGNPTVLWGRDAKVLESIERSGRNPKYLAGLDLHKTLRVERDLVKAIEAASVIVCSIPTQNIREVFSGLSLGDRILLNTSKGLEVGSHFRVSQIFSQLAPECRYGVLSGPSFAEELIKKQPTAVTIASLDKALAESIQNAVRAPYFRAYTTLDVVGVELAGSMKNVVAIATGIVKGCRLGHNAQSAVITRGLAEIARMGRALGASPATFLGLAGVGDLVLTCTGPLSRNLRAGILLGEGKPLNEVVRELGGVAEGIYTTVSAFELSRKHGIDMPILREVYSILYEGKSPKASIEALMEREPKEEAV